MQNKNRVPAVERALDILEHLIARNEAVTINELSRELDLPRVSVFRIIKSLEARGYVYNQGQQGRYVLGAKVVTLGNRVSRDTNLTQIASAFMFELARTTGQTVQLGVLFEYQVMYIDQILTTMGLTLVVPTRRPFAVNISAGGKVLVAHLDAAGQREFLLHVDFKPNTPRTIVDKSAFRMELARVEAQGYATDNEEFARGIRCVAAPIYNAAGENIASVGITGHTQELTDARMPGLIRDTVDTAAGISQALGHAPSGSCGESAAAAR